MLPYEEKVEKTILSINVDKKTDDWIRRLAKENKRGISETVEVLLKLARKTLSEES